MAALSCDGRPQYSEARREGMDVKLLVGALYRDVESV